jgi:hypothetical protein
MNDLNAAIFERIQQASKDARNTTPDEPPAEKITLARNAATLTAALLDTLYFNNPLDLDNHYTRQLLKAIETANQTTNTLNRLIADLNLGKVDAADLARLTSPPKESK